MRLLKKFIYKILNLFFSQNRILGFYQQFKSSSGINIYKKDYFKEMRDPKAWKLIPLGVRVFKPSNNETINSNEIGFRTHNFNLKDRKIIIILGGSASWGMGVSADNKVFSSLLEDKLKNKDIKWCVVNLSMMSATSQQELLYFIFWGLKLNPEIVISFSGFNDLSLPNNFFDKKNKIFILPDILKYKKNFDKFHSQDSSLLKKMYSFLIKSEKEVKKNIYEKEINFKERSEVFLRSNELLVNLSKTYGFKYYTILQPNSYNKKKTDEEQKQFEFYTREHDSKTEYMQCYKFAKQDSLYHHIINNKSNTGIFLNYENLFDNNSNNVFIDGIVHLNDHGHEIISNKIYDQLIKDGFS